jgi:hypothetical protein
MPFKLALSARLILAFIIAWCFVFQSCKPLSLFSIRVIFISLLFCRHFSRCVDFASSLIKLWLKRWLVGLWQCACKLDLILLLVTCPSSLPKTLLKTLTWTLCLSYCPSLLTKTPPEASTWTLCPSYCPSSISLNNYILIIRRISIFTIITYKTKFFHFRQITLSSFIANIKMS